MRVCVGYGLFELGDLAVLELRSALELARIRGARFFLSCACELLVQFRDALDRTCLALPFRLHRIRLLREVCEIALDVGKARLRRIVLFLRERQSLHLELRYPTLDLVDLDRHRLGLHAES